MTRTLPRLGLLCPVAVILLTCAGTALVQQVDKKTIDKKGLDPGKGGKSLFTAPIPKKHNSLEVDNLYGEWVVKSSILPPRIGQKQGDLSGIMPEWVALDDSHLRITDINPVVLEGLVVGKPPSPFTKPKTVVEILDPGPHVSFEDFPISHYTHDFCFHVKPDATPDNRFTNLLAILHDPETKQEKPQPAIEVEWECGLGAANDGNPAAGVNRRGDSFGFYSAGHKRRQIIHHWPTLGDWVHVVGNWMWDRGHPPAEMEIHPPRLVAIRRHLPAFILAPAKGKDAKVNRLLATQVDIFASGDGGALMNNRTGVPKFVKKVPMSDRDYDFLMEHTLPRPSPKAQLRVKSGKSPTDTFPGEPTVEVFGDGSPDKKAPHVKITLPWKTRKAPDTAIFHRTIHLYWDESLGVPADFKVSVFDVILDRVQIHKTHDTGWGNDGEYRLFVEAGGNWVFVNELPNVDNILEDGLGDTGEDTWTINKAFRVYVPPGKTFRVHAGGWEADGIDTVMGRLTDNFDRSERQKQWLLDNIFTKSMVLNGADDDPIGEVNHVFNAATATARAGKNRQITSRGDKRESRALGAQDTDPNGSFTLFFHIDEHPWPPK